MDVNAVAAIRARSRAAFGQQYRLEVMIAIAADSDGMVCLTDLGRSLGLSLSNIQGALRSLVEVGLLTELPAGDSRRKFYLRNPSAAWTWASELAQGVCVEVGP